MKREMIKVVVGQIWSVYGVGFRVVDVVNKYASLQPIKPPKDPSAAHVKKTALLLYENDLFPVADDFSDMWHLVEDRP